jgi:hypothetical protein
MAGRRTSCMTSGQGTRSVARACLSIQQGADRSECEQKQRSQRGRAFHSVSTPFNVKYSACSGCLHREEPVTRGSPS